MTFTENQKKNFHEFIIENDVIGFFQDPIELKSGRLSYFYVNWRDITSDVYLIDRLTDYIIQFAKELEFTRPCFLGVPEGATKIGILTQFKWAKLQKDYGKNEYILSMARGKPKKHGALKDRAYVGIPQDDVIVIEDVTTTGQSLIKTIDQLLELELNVIAAISLTNRDEKRSDGKTVEEIVQERGIPLKSMSHATELLPKVFEIKHKPNKKLARKIESYFNEYGIKPLNLRD